MQIPQISRSMAALLVIVLVGVCGLAIAYAFGPSIKRQELFMAPRGSEPTQAVEVMSPVAGLGLPTLRPPGAPIYTPTPDAPHSLPSMRTDPESYVVRVGNSLGGIAGSYGVSVEQIVQENGIANPNLLAIGQVLTIPAPSPGPPGPDFKVIPDSELVYGPASALFDLEAFVQQGGGYLVNYREEVDDQYLSGAQIVQRIAQDFSLNPRLLLALLQHQSGWWSDPAPGEAQKEYPLGLPNPKRDGLYRQLSWAANQLNRGYYLFQVNGVASWVLGDGSIVPLAPTINAGTAGVQQFFAALYDRAAWEQAVTEGGLFATYYDLFGYPFDYAIEPLLPPGLAQPAMQLPIEPETLWAFTGGPHASWGDGTAWGALDFAPPGDQVGCVLSDDWVVAVADGTITRAANGAVIQDLDGDGYEQTGWVVLYMHIESRERVVPGTFLKAGEQRRPPLLRRRSLHRHPRTPRQAL